MRMTVPAANLGVIRFRRVLGSGLGYSADTNMGFARRGRRVCVCVYMCMYFSMYLCVFMEPFTYTGEIHTGDGARRQVGMLIYLQEPLPHYFVGPTPHELVTRYGPMK